jgi:hypothetical protein
MGFDSAKSGRGFQSRLRLSDTTAISNENHHNIVIVSDAGGVTKSGYSLDKPTIWKTRPKWSGFCVLQNEKASCMGAVSS